MSESRSVRRRNPEPESSRTRIRGSRSEPSVFTSRNATTSTNRESKRLFEYTVPSNAWFLPVVTQTLVVSAKFAVSLLILLLVTSLFALILSYTGLSTIHDQLPHSRSFTSHLLRVIHNFSMGSAQKRHKLRVYRF
ncbi:unnamed protein product [Candidula unifasciata]|uniref:Uncharacterized protein n=1 Tax=Candidula unifasciata TaxID=100452 RepID=A0A8S4A5F3_9EUPU|nr:unnamed protein product [Candidula unifasciata]